MRVFQKPADLKKSTHKHSKSNREGIVFMDNYVRRCVMYAVIGVILTIIIGLGASIHNRNKPVVVSDNADLTQAVTTVQEVTLTKTLVRALKRDATKLPDEGRPSHENAVEPPTEVAFGQTVGIAYLPDVPDVPVKDTIDRRKVMPLALVEEAETEAETEVETEIVVFDAPKYAAEHEVVEVAEVVEVKESAPLFYGAGRYASITLTDEQNELMARLIYHECRGIGGAAVAETVFNRKLSSEFPNTIEDVIYAKNAFSPSGILWTASIDEPEALERCREIPREVLNSDTYLLPSTDYCYFHAGHATLPGDYEYGGNVFYADYAAHH